MCLSRDFGAPIRQLLSWLILGGVGSFTSPWSLAADMAPMTPDSSVTVTGTTTFAELATIRVGARWPKGFSDVGAFDQANGKLYTFTIAGDFKSRTFRVIDVLAGQVAGKPMKFAGAGGTGPVGFDALRNRLYIGNNEGNKILVVNGSTMERSGRPIKLHSPVFITVDAPKNLLYVSQYADNTVIVVDGETRRAIGNPIPVGIQPGSSVINPHNNSLYVVNYEGTVSVIDLGSMTVKTTIPVGTDSINIALNTATNRLYVSSEQSDSVVVIDGESDTVIASIPVGTSGFGIAVDEASNRIYVTKEREAQVIVIDGQTNSVLATVPVGSGGASPEGCELFVDCKRLGADPLDLFADPTTGKVYVGLGGNGKVSVIGSKPQ